MRAALEEIVGTARRIDAEVKAIAPRAPPLPARSAGPGLHYAAPSMTTYLVRKVRRIDSFAEQVPGPRLLTAHEKSILRRIALDRTRKEIAQELPVIPTDPSHACMA